TSEFGMGSGGTTALSPPGKFLFHSSRCTSVAFASYLHNHQNQSLNKLNIVSYESFITHKTPSVL
ncbi:hypothetical protein SOV78_15795, partial [Pectobacterium brasiliense]|uniref:hypothetical protein n=1 Tax=Pectobacterium brasiliense TaxID=180957 RepID=UPI002A7EB7BD